MTDAVNPTTLVGKKAPDFKVPGYYKGEFKDYSLSDFKGKWTLVLFYPLDFTFVCPTEVLSFSRSTPEFEELDCQVLGISVDSQFVHKAWVETDKAEGGLGGKLAADRLVARVGRCGALPKPTRRWIAGP